ncbi:hypothetical protein KIN20_018711 [Parelaphostrongylus tenuis]|uniref:Uncharacterized protein n=1 Tax=Parelaphostrongylus tenuis TaxID=148309 RepID=A0AAD5QSD3_PARTN|nr:hypothetical protein KIN20_018711 [Parelaphostrongylus tenuis]
MQMLSRSHHVQFQFPPTVPNAVEKCDANGPDASIRTARFSTLCHIIFDQFAMMMFVVYTNFLQNELYIKGASRTERAPEIIKGAPDIGITVTSLATVVSHFLLSCIRMQILVTVLPTILQLGEFASITARNYGS